MRIMFRAESAWTIDPHKTVYLTELQLLLQRRSAQQCAEDAALKGSPHAANKTRSRVLHHRACACKHSHMYSIKKNLHPQVLFLFRFASRTSVPFDCSISLFALFRAFVLEDH